MGRLVLPRRWALAAVALLFAGAAGAGAAPASADPAQAPASASASAPAGSGDGVTVSPVRIERDVDTDAVEAVVRVRNQDAQPTTVAVHTAGLGHDLDGAPRFDPDDAHADAVTAEPSRLDLAAHEQREVIVRGSLPGDGLYAAVLVEVDPAPAPEAAVGARAQIASFLMIRGPEPWDEQIAVDAVELHEQHDGDVTLEVHVRNEGEVHVRPVGRATVTDAAGEELAEVDLDGPRVLPGYARRFTAPVQLPAGATGPFDVEVTFSDPAAETQLTVELVPAPEEARAAGRDDAADAGGTRVEGGAGTVPPWLLAAALALLLAVSLGVGWGWARERDRRGGGRTVATPQAPAPPGAADPVMNRPGSARPQVRSG